ncbi:hypothetical protein [Nocardiopsis oceani]
MVPEEAHGDAGRRGGAEGAAGEQFDQLLGPEPEDGRLQHLRVQLPQQSQGAVHPPHRVRGGKAPPDRISHLQGVREGIRVHPGARTVRTRFLAGFGRPWVDRAVHRRTQGLGHAWQRRRQRRHQRHGQQEQGGVLQ